jgi:hypothetical protein
VDTSQKAEVQYSVDVSACENSAGSDCVTCKQIEDWILQGLLDNTLVTSGAVTVTALGRCEDENEAVTKVIIEVVSACSTTTQVLEDIYSFQQRIPGVLIEENLDETGADTNATGTLLTLLFVLCGALLVIVISLLCFLNYRRRRKNGTTKRVLVEDYEIPA